MTGAGASWMPGKGNGPPRSGFSRIARHLPHRPATGGGWALGPRVWGPRGALGVCRSWRGAWAVGAPAGTVPSALGSAPVLLTLATFEAETSRRRAAAFMPDSAMVEMLLIKGSS